MRKASKVTVIPAKVQNHLIPLSSEYVKRRVAAYARVSSNTEEQLNSYEAQVDYYTKYIKKNEEWEFIKVYTDEGITAVNTRKRDGFNQMVDDALAGKIDLIVTKSVSRFARNTVDTLITVRKLKEKGVEIYFEKENIYTLDAKGELLITIMSSLAQEESRSISENVTWGHRKRFADGKIMLPYKRFLGYKKGSDDIPVIVESEAVIIRSIFRMFLFGMTFSGIAAWLTSHDIPTPGGKRKWSGSTVQNILQNEKYKGDALLQKSYTVDFLTKKTKINQGEVPQYYVENSHEAIIPPDTFDLVQYEIMRRKNDKRGRKFLSAFSYRVVCGKCGSFFGHKVWNGATKYRKKVWECSTKYKKGTYCDSGHFSNDQLQAIFVLAFNRIAMRLESIREDYQPIIAMLTDTTEFDAKVEAAAQERDVVLELMERCIKENTQVAQDQAKYQLRYQELVSRYEAAVAELNELESERVVRTGRRAQILFFFEEMGKCNGPLERFDEEIFFATVHEMRVEVDHSITVVFRDGSIELISKEDWKDA